MDKTTVNRSSHLTKSSREGEDRERSSQDSALDLAYDSALDSMAQLNNIQRSSVDAASVGFELFEIRCVGFLTLRV